MDIINALTYYLEDEKCKQLYKKMLMYLPLCLIPVLGLILYLIIFAGYFYAFINCRTIKSKIEVPKINIKQAFALTSKVILFGFIVGIVPNIVERFAVNLHGENIPLDTLLGLIVMYFAFYLFYDLALMSFKTNLKLGAFFDFQKIKFMLVDNFKDYAIFSLWRIAMVIAIYIVLIALCLFVFGVAYVLSIMAAIPSTTTAAIILALLICGVFALLLEPAFYFIFADLDIQFLRKIFKIDIVDVEETQG